MTYDLDERMKEYEAQTNTSLMRRVPVIARLDGRAFHNFTKYAARPYSEPFRSLMIETAEYLLNETAAVAAYTQSDEITLAWELSNVFFNGRVPKMTSTLAAMASVKFNALLNAMPNSIQSGLGWVKLPTFDCRVFAVPDETEAVNAFVWRQHDAIRNSIEMAAQAYFSHAETLKHSGPELQEMLFQKHGINWSRYPDDQKRGTFIRRIWVERRFSEDEIAELPEKHEARKNPNLVVRRNATERTSFELARLSNGVSALFYRAAPVSKREERTEQGSTVS